MTSEAINPKILGVRVDNFSVPEIKARILEILEKKSEQKFVATLNPEILLKAHRDGDYKNILNSVDLNVCDGFGLKLVSFLKGKALKARLTGVDLADFLLNEASKKNLRVLIVVAQNSLSRPEEIEQAARAKYPEISAKSEYFPAGQIPEKNDIIEKAEVVFVNFGAPEQEKFIFEHRQKFSNAKILVGVGGTFDFLTGKIRRAPKILRALGLEWLWRLAIEPKRFRRIWNAVVVFPVAALFDKN